MTFSIGNKVVYPGQGPCRIGAVVQKLIGGQIGSYYRLISLDDHAETIFVPVDKTDGEGIRRLINKSDITGVLRQLARSTEQKTNWKQRDFFNLKRLSTGSAYDLAKVVESLTGLNEWRPLALRERQTLERARKLLICEISEVSGESRSATAQHVDNALRVQTVNASGKQQQSHLDEW